MKQALIIIDLQRGSFTPEAKRHDPDGLKARLNALAERVRESGGAVIFVMHDGPPGDPHEPQTPGWMLMQGLKVLDGDYVARKASCDAFLDTKLEEIIEQAGVEALIITGCATDYCVDTTVRSALARGYPTIVPSDGHTTSDRPHLPATKIIEHHNAIWSDFIAPGGPAILCACAEVPLR